MHFAVATREDATSSLVRYEVGIYGILGAYTGPLLLVSAVHLKRLF